MALPYTQSGERQTEGAEIVGHSKSGMEHHTNKLHKLVAQLVFGTKYDWLGFSLFGRLYNAV